MPTSKPFISEFLLKIYHFPSFWKSLSSTKLTYTPTLSAIYVLNISDQIEVSLNADVLENTLPFVSQSINNFSDYDISQSVDWECHSLSPHVLLFSILLRLCPWSGTSETQELGMYKRPHGLFVLYTLFCSVYCWHFYDFTDFILCSFTFKALLRVSVVPTTTFFKINSYINY